MENKVAQPMKRTGKNWKNIKVAWAVDTTKRFIRLTCGGIKKNNATTEENVFVFSKCNPFGRNIKDIIKKQTRLLDICEKDKPKKW